MEKVDSITSSSLSIIPGVNPAEQFLAVSRESTPALNTIDFGTTVIRFPLLHVRKITYLMEKD